MHLSNPHALYALLALPVIILIHCLQERSRRRRVSTLFLLERVAPESVSGARWERLRTSVPFWLQIIATLLITWVLAAPRWLKKDSSQTVVVILDSSASMSAFRSEARAALVRILERWRQNAESTRWHVLESDARKPTLYAGPHLPELLAAVDQWQPLNGAHSPDESYRIARSLVKGGSGIVIHVTCRKIDVPSDIALLAVGGPKENVGFSGLTTSIEAGHLKWRVLVTNHGASPQTRHWWLERQGIDSPVKTALELRPGQSLALDGELPPDVQQATLVLDSDAFTLDDRLPFRRPLARLLRVNAAAPGPSGAQLRKMIEAVPGVEITSTSPDLTLAEIGTEAATDAIYIASPAQETRLDAAAVVAENHPLTRDLGWSGLLTQKPAALALLDTDVPLLWKGDGILAFLRRTRNADGRPVEQLLLNWDLAKSNAARLPALLVLLQRHLEARHAALEGERMDNYETNQPIALSGDATTARLLQDGRTAPFAGHAPARPGFFEITRQNQALVHGACYFADAREASLLDCASADTTEPRRLQFLLRETEADPWAAVWVLAVLGCLLGAWGWKEGRVLGVKC